MSRNATMRPYTLEPGLTSSTELKPTLRHGLIFPAPFTLGVHNKHKTNTMNLALVRDTLRDPCTAAAYRILETSHEDACHVNQSPIAHTLYSLCALSCISPCTCSFRASAGACAWVPLVRPSASVCLRARALDRVSHRSSTAACSEADGAPDFAKAHGRRRKPQARCG